MKTIKSDRGFVVITHETYPPGSESGGARLVGESSAIGDYDDSFDRPGSSYLWVGNDFHLNREEVEELRSQLQHWLDTGRLGEVFVVPEPSS